MTRTALGVISVLAASTLLLAGCGGTDEAADNADSVTVDTLKGEVEVPAGAKNVVVLNSPAADAAAGMGVTPVAVASTKDQIMPWQKGVTDDVADDSLINAEYAPNLEKIAEYEPDVIFAAPWNIADDSTYEQLSDIAPVIIPDTESANPDWDEMTEQVGEALGKSDEAEKLIDTTKDKLEAVGADLGVDGKSYQLISPRAEGIYFGNAAPLELFGLEPGQHQTPEEINKFTLSTENLDELDADYLFVWAMDDDGKKQVVDNPSYDSLPSVKNGTAAFIDAEFATAVNAASPASLDWLVTDSGIEDMLRK
ncbi:ABC transporter substrate-binding protein [Brevibacterium sediminis]|uniref:ABC transporter substrate-binding protein n=1 Tax=Brevibacterium sediminis TaxID=1857024 RepID=UPI002175583D|nr:ABC transporter substrate-binding protein [Brevibacterium sediminis]MCS4591672.1 ABC transporter substrate-binding protein [Brevibacterium sediminis]